LDQPSEGWRQNFEWGMNPLEQWNKPPGRDMFASMQPSARAQGWRAQWDAAVAAAKAGTTTAGSPGAIPTGEGGPEYGHGAPQPWWEAWQPGKLSDLPDALKNSPYYKQIARGLTYRPPWMQRLLNIPGVKAGPGGNDRPITPPAGPGQGASGWWGNMISWQP
jgi:hypothetical protein